MCALKGVHSVEAVSAGFSNSCSHSFVFASRDNTLSVVHSSGKTLCVGLGGMQPSLIQLIPLIRQFH